MRYQATFFSAYEMQILADEPAEYFKLYGFIRSRMDIKTKISGVESKFSTQSFREVLKVPPKRGRRKIDVKEKDFYSSGMIQKRLFYLEKIGLIKRRNDLGCFVFEHIYPLLPKFGPNDDGQMTGTIRDTISDKKNPMKALESKEVSRYQVTDDSYDEDAMRGTPLRYIDNNILLSLSYDKDNCENLPFSPPEEAKKLKTKKDVPNCPYEKIIDLYHKLLPTAPKVLILSESRKVNIRARWKEYWSKDYDAEMLLAIFETVFTYVSQSDFLLGKVQSFGRRPFKISIDWIMNRQNFLKIIEGKYFNG